MNSAGSGSNRAFRGLALVFILTFVNLVGLLVTVTALGGLGEWTRWQFMGLFGIIEFSAGTANILAPNIWHLPAAEINTSSRTNIKLAATAMMLPHWGGAARAVAGLSLLLASGFLEGWSIESLLLLPECFLLVVLMLAVSAVIARAAIFVPELDTLQFVVRWRGRESELAPLSISASIQQFVLGVLTLPAVKTLTPGALFAPELRPSGAALLITAALTLLFTVGTLVLWRDRIQWRAPREQQQEAEMNA